MYTFLLFGKQFKKKKKKKKESSRSNKCDFPAN